MKKGLSIIIGVLVIVVILLVFINPFNDKDAENIVKIGAIFPLTGDLSAYGISMKNAIELAVDEINEKELLNKKFEIINEDTKGIPKDCIAAFEKLTNIDKVSVIVGPMSSSEMLSIAPIAEKSKVVILSPSASSPEITNSGDYIFRIAPSDSYEGIMVAQYAIETLKINSIGILYNNSEYGIGIANKFSEYFSEGGGKVLIKEPYSNDIADFKTQLLKIKNKDPEAFYLVGYKELGKIVKQAKELGINKQILSVSLFEDPDILTTAGLAAEGIIFPSISFIISSEDKRAIEFVESYNDKYGQEPDAFAASAYDAMHIIFIALKEAGMNTKDIKNKLYHIKSFKGLLGEFGFDENGDVILPITLKTVKNGKFISIK